MASTMRDLVAAVMDVRPDMAAAGVTREAVEAAVSELRDRLYEEYDAEAIGELAERVAERVEAG